MNSYPKHVGDYVRDTVGLSMLEDGAYNRLLDQYYAREKPLPKDIEKVYRLARATGARERKAVDSILEQFFPLEADGYHNKRADEELARQRSRSQSAKDSADARWSSGRNANASDSHTDSHGKRNASPKPEALSPKPLSQKPEAKDSGESESKAGAENGCSLSPADLRIASSREVDQFMDAEGIPIEEREMLELCWGAARRLKHPPQTETNMPAYIIQNALSDVRSRPNSPKPLTIKYFLPIVQDHAARILSGKSSPRSERISLPARPA